MSTEPRFEIGADYDGSDYRHHQVNEVRTFNNEKVDRIFIPECGVFYTESMIIRDMNTGTVLERGIHYEVMVLDPEATNKSGKEVCGIVVITDNDIAGVILEYRFVGGLHSTGYYILEQLIKMYPEGTGGTISWYDLINIPDDFAPAYHTQHVHEFYKTDELLIRLERLRQQIIERYNDTLASLYDNAQETINKLYYDLEKKGDKLLDDIAETLKKISIQSDEYILTDSAEDPYIKRKYGQWELVTNKVLHGVSGTVAIIGHGGTIGIGSERIIRNCYIWKNIQNSVAPNTPSFEITSDVNPVYSGDTIKFTVICNNIPDGTTIKWSIDQGNTDESIAAKFYNPISATVKDGKFTASLTTIKSGYYRAARTHTFYLVDASDAAYDFVIMDKTTTLNTDTIGFVNVLNKPIVSVSEDEKFKLKVTATTSFGRTAYIKWVYGTGLSAADFKEPLPTTLALASTNNYIALETVGNLKENDNRLLTAYLLSYEGEAVAADTPVAHVEIRDTSKEFLGTIKFYTPEGLLTDNVNEGADFVTRFESNGGIGREVTFSYRSNKIMDEFEGLITKGNVNTSKRIEWTSSVIADFFTNEEQAFLEVTAKYNNQVVAVNTIMINDTYQTPEFDSLWSTTNDGSQRITMANDGDKFYGIIRIPGWSGSKISPKLNLKLSYTGGSTLANRFSYPADYENLNFDGTNNKVGIEWINGNTIAIAIEAKALKAIIGDGELRLDYKLDKSEQYTTGPVLKVINTSLPTVDATPSSSMTTLTPITQINEMTTMGENSVFYVWLEFDGDATTFDNLKMDFAAESQAGKDDITMVLPTNIEVKSGVNKQVLTCGVNADFLTEGNEKLILKGTADNVEGEVFRLEILLIDNSIRTNLTMQLSTSATAIIAPPTKMSEWDVLYAHFTYASYQFATTLSLTDSSESHFKDFKKTVTLPASTTKHVTEYHTNDERRTDGRETVHNLTAVRTHNSKVMTNTATASVTYLNDKVPPSIVYSYVSESETHPSTAVTKFEEGKEYYIHVGVKNTYVGQITTVNLRTNDSTGYGAVIKDRISGFTNNLVVTKTDANTVLKDTINAYATFSVINNRVTDTKNELYVDFCSSWDSKYAGNKFGDVVALSPTNTTNQLNSTIAASLVDTSKTPTIADINYYNDLGNVTGVIEEGKTVRYDVTINGGTIGDRWVVMNNPTNGVGMDRFETHEFDTVPRTVTSTTGWKASWTHKILANERTDDSNVVRCKIKNLEDGTILDIAKTYTISDTSKSTTLSTRWLHATSNVVITSIDEGKTARLEVTVEEPNKNTKVSYTRTDGRTMDDMQSPTDFGVTKAIPAGGGKIYFEFTPAENFKVDEVNFIKGVVSLDSNKTLTEVVQLTVNDTSQGGNVSEFMSEDAAGTKPFVSSLSEGNTYYMQVSTENMPAGTVLTIGIEQDYDNIEIAEKTLTLDANGKGTLTVRAKSATEVTSPYGEVIKFRVIFTSVLLPEPKYSKSYYTTHSTANGNVFKSSTWKRLINGAFVNVSSSNLPLEGETVYCLVKLNVTHPNLPVTMDLDMLASDGYAPTQNGINRFTALDSVLNVDNNYEATFRVQTHKDYDSSDVQSYSSCAVMFSAHGNKYRSTFKLEDNSKLPTITAMYWSTSWDGSNQITNVEYGQTFYLIIKTLNIGDDAAVVMNISNPNSTFLQQYLQVGNITGTRVVNVGTYNSGDKTGHTYIEYKVAEDPQPIISQPADGYYRASDSNKLSQIVIGPGETLFIQMAAGDGGDSNSFGDYGGWTIGPQATSHVIFKPGMTPQHSGGYVTRSPENLVNYGSQAVVNTSTLTNNLLIATTPANATGYYSDDYGNGGSDQYLDNEYGGEFGVHYISSYAGLEITNVVVGYYDSVNDFIAAISPGDEQGERYSGYGAFYQFNLKNTTTNPITLPVLLNDAEGIVTTRYDSVANIGYIRIFNETKATAVGKSLIYGKSYVLFNNRTGHAITALCIDHETSGVVIAYTIIKQSLNGVYSTIAPIRLVQRGTFPSRENVYRNWTTDEKNALINNPNIGYLVSGSDTERTYRIDGDNRGFEILPEYTASGTNYLNYDVYFYDANGTQIGHVKRVGVMQYNRLGGASI